jgi:hypothetical protein
MVFKENDISLTVPPESMDAPNGAETDRPKTVN